ncbi:hypothetical protein KAU43_02675 [candidate division WOR-3 bacterium]|jgi:hypothetical protein|nr:hypothetical protein [candidate division WOR-3 bacterium]
MKRKMLIPFLIILLLVAGCRYYIIDNEPPQIPTGVTSITGDGKVTLYWNPVSDKDFFEYNVYRSYDLEGPYTNIASVRSAFFVDHSVYNGVTYFYAIASVDDDCNESELSREDVYDTPRPAGYGAVIWDRIIYPYDAGFNLALEEVVPYNAYDCHFYLESDIQSYIYYLKTGYGDNDIQDFGYIDSIDDIDYAPLDGWSQTGKVEAITGHGYIIWTKYNHFAKIRINSIYDDHIIFDWAYQIDTGNRELSMSANHF